ncbi:hypothetical protein FOM02_24550 [Bradyrhizobium sp. SEMIA]|uniref:Uncharacterized protein n=2 Tax=Nitrobacteraceae TaxID=41294 RepID=A0AAE7NWN2_9BRAD|nr:hypothetical protein FOM02_24550 [Bradyrhizobium sp. SEMIA]QOZ73394.1 hypothetical protein WN72_16490 [Bradyrhizobium arachidis]
MSGLTAGLAQTAQETVPTMLAAQIRMQGFACEKALSAVKDSKRSKPDREVWVLKCSNATYRVGRAPDMAANVERLK